jgi:glucosamine--fructose-6-phosphate aminotransferase (isomerizing)
MAETLKLAPQIKKMARRYAGVRDVMYIGRALGYPIAMEGALKLKELSYVHAEGYAAGELKHGPIALLDRDTPLVAIATRGATYEKVVSNIAEVRAREAPVIAVATEGDEEITRYAQDVLYVPETIEAMAPIVATLPLQLLAYEVAVARGTDVDQPRNLAKSVTVE